MKICLQNKTPILTKEVNPSWNCPKTCCFHKFYMKHSISLCSRFKKRCAKGHSYTLYNDISDIFKI